MKKLFYWIALGVILASVVIALEQIEVQNTYRSQHGYYVKLQKDQESGIIMPYGAEVYFLELGNASIVNLKILDVTSPGNKVSIIKLISPNHSVVLKRSGFYLMSSEGDFTFIFRLVRVGFDNWDVLIVILTISIVIVEYGLLRRKMI